MTRTLTRIAATTILAAATLGAVGVPAQAGESWTYSGRSADGGFTYKNGDSFITYTSYKGAAINFEFSQDGTPVKVD